MEAEGEKKGATSTEKGEMMVEEQGEKGVGAPEAEKGKMVEEQGGKGVGASEAEKGEMVKDQGPSDLDKEAVEAKEVPSGRFITVKSSDGEIHVVSEAAAQLSGHLRRMGQDGCTDDIIPLPSVAASTLVAVLEYCNKHAEAASKRDSDPTAGSTSAAASSEDLEAWDREFVDRHTMGPFRDLVLAARYLDIKGLLDIICNKAADMIVKGSITDEIRDAFDIDNDITPEEEADPSLQYAWNFDV